VARFLLLVSAQDPHKEHTMRSYWSPLVLAGLLALANGCKEQGADTSSTHTTSAPAEPSAGMPQGTPQGTPQQGTPQHPVAAPAPLTSDDKEFMTKAAQGGMAQIALGQDAARKATNPDVKAFAEKMSAEHMKANDELASLAHQKGATLPTQLDDKHQKQLDKLTKYSGTKFDKEYAADMVNDHEADVKEFRKAAKDVKDPDLRSWAEKQIPMLESQLATAKDIKAKAKAEKKEK